MRKSESALGLWSITENRGVLGSARKQPFAFAFMSVIRPASSRPGKRSFAHGPAAARHQEVRDCSPCAAGCASRPSKVFCNHRKRKRLAVNLTLEQFHPRAPPMRGCMLRIFCTFGAAVALASGIYPGTFSIQSERTEFFITTVAEHRVSRLPSGALYWRVEEFATAAGAKSHESEFALSATVENRHWLFTLGPPGGSTPRAARIAEIGPIATPAVKTYLLRINHAGGPPGAQTPVHSHPGAEAIYVLSGEVTQQTKHGRQRAKAAQGLNAHEGDMAMQLTSTGQAGLSQLVMFVVDADRPFSPRAEFE